MVNFFSESVFPDIRYLYIYIDILCQPLALNLKKKKKKIDEKYFN